MKNPIKIVSQSKGRVKLVCSDAVVVLNREGKVIITWATGLERSGRDASEIERLLADTVPSTIRPPAVEECSDRYVCLTFDSWDLHGGILCRWRVRFGENPKIEHVVIAEGVGGYRRFFY